MLTRDVAEGHAASLSRELESGHDPFFIKLRLWDPSGFDLLLFEAVEREGHYYLRLRVRQQETGKTGYVETEMGRVNDTSYDPGDEETRAMNMMEDMANLGPRFLIWDG